MVSIQSPKDFPCGLQFILYDKEHGAEIHLDSTVGMQSC
jgi:hypothetical protein